VAKKTEMWQWAKAELAKMLLQDIGYDPLLKKTLLDKLRRDEA